MNVNEYLSSELREVKESLDSVGIKSLEELSFAVSRSPLTVFSGVGKAGLVGRRLAALSSSTGSPSVFLCPTDSLHGDLGIIGCDHALFIFLSNSGETKELVHLAKAVEPHEKWAITSAPLSTLGKVCNDVVSYDRPTEPGPLGLPPTASTTVIGMIGNAALMKAMEIRGFDRESYAEFHQGGQLGGMSVLVDEVMREPFTIHYDEWRGRHNEIAYRMASNHTGIVCIYDYIDGNTVWEVATIADVVRGGRQESDPIMISSGSSVSEAMALMRDHHVNQLPVLDGEKVVGVVDIQSLVGLHLDI